MFEHDIDVQVDESSRLELTLHFGNLENSGVDPIRVDLGEEERRDEPHAQHGEDPAAEGGALVLRTHFLEIIYSE